MMVSPDLKEKLETPVRMFRNPREPREQRDNPVSLASPDSPELKVRFMDNSNDQ